MRYAIKLILDFKCEASDGIVTGDGDMVSHIDDFLPRIGEIIMPGSGDSGINVISERYLIKIRDILHFSGGDKIRLFYCDVTISTMSIWLGKPYEHPAKNIKQIIDDWRSLAYYYNNNTWNDEAKKGTFIVTLMLNNKNLR